MLKAAILVAALFCGNDTPRKQGPILRAIAALRRQECNGQQCVLVEYQWMTYQGHHDRVYLYRDGIQVGGWNKAHRVYMPFTNGQWGDVCLPPVPAPE